MNGTDAKSQIALWSAGDRVEGFFLLKDASQRVTSAGKDYLTGSIADQDSSIEFKVWDYKGPVGPKNVGNVVKVRGEVSEYRGSLQLTVERIRQAVPEDGFDASRLAPPSRVDVKTCAKEVEDLLDSIENEECRKLAKHIYEKHKETFHVIPAAKTVHHSFRSGLLMHTLSMMKLADAVCKLYPVADRSLLLAGTFLHDVAKEREFSLSDLGLVIDYSVEGELLGHLVMGAEEVEKAATELSIGGETPLLLKHMLLSHHGLPEYGAARSPATPEAELLSLIDLIDSRMELFSETFESVENGTLSGKIRFLGDRKLYKRL